MDRFFRAGGNSTLPEGSMRPKNELTGALELGLGHVTGWGIRLGTDFGTESLDLRKMRTFGH
jgi:hypothetical protein